MTWENISLPSVLRVVQIHYTEPFEETLHSALDGVFFARDLRTIQARIIDSSKLPTDPPPPDEKVDAPFAGAGATGGVPGSETSNSALEPLGALKRSPE
jgi:hypothetical protein